VSLSHELHSHFCRSLTLRAPVLQHCVYQSQATTMGRLVHISLGYQVYLVPPYSWDTNYICSHPIPPSMSREVSISTSHKVYITASHEVYNLPLYFFIYESRRLRMYVSQILQIYESRRGQPPNGFVRHEVYTSMSHDVYILMSQSNVRHEVYTSMSHDVHTSVSHDVYSLQQYFCICESRNKHIYESRSIHIYVRKSERRCVYVTEDTKSIKKWTLP